jgi:hypothetical protein
LVLAPVLEWKPGVERVLKLAPEQQQERVEEEQRPGLEVHKGFVVVLAQRPGKGQAEWKETGNVEADLAQVVDLGMGEHRSGQFVACIVEEQALVDAKSVVAVEAMGVASFLSQPMLQESIAMTNPCHLVLRA